VAPMHLLGDDDDFMAGRERIVDYISRDDLVLDEDEDIFSTFVDGIERPPGGETLIRRNHQGRPYIRPVDENGNVLELDNVTYTRVTTFIDKIDDHTNIHNWEMREMLAFLATPSGEVFLLEAASYNPKSDGYKGQMRDLCERILERSGAKDRATKGTAVHAITERDDQGMDVSSIPTRYSPHLSAYREFVRHFEMMEIERFVVNDRYRTGGTPDRIVRYKPCKMCGAELYIEDLKTGRVDNYTELTISMQLALYAHSKLYDIATGARIEMPPICLHKGIVVHLPAHSQDPLNEGGVKWVNIARGWRYVDLCAHVARAREETNLVVPFEPTTNVWPLLRLADSAITVRRIFEAHRVEFDADPRLVELMTLRLEELAT
jgi:hypothetical protein